MTVSIDALRREISATRRRLDREAGEARSVALRGRQVQAELAEIKQLREDIERAVGVLTSIGEQRQASAQRQIEALVTHGLRTIFGEDLSFHIVQTVSRNQQSVEFVIRTVTHNGTVVDTPVMEARGGGVASVVGFMLRLVVALLSPQRQAPVMLLDETFAHLSAEYEPRLAEFLRELVDKTPAQIILVTHSTAFSDSADVVYQLELVDGATQIKRL